MKLAAYAVAVTAGLCGAAQAQTWNLATSFNDGNFTTQTIRGFAEDLTAVTDGKIKVVVHSNASLFKRGDIKRAVQTGQVPMGHVTFASLANEDPIWAIDGLPFLCDGYDCSLKLYRIQRPYLDALSRRQGLILLYAEAWPGAGVFSKGPIESLRDLKGQKFRAFNQLTSRLVELFGAVPTTLASGEVAQAFATGLISGMVTSATTGVDTGSWDYAGYFYDTDAWQNKTGLFMHLATFNALDADTKNKLLAVAGRAEHRGWTLSQRSHDEAKAKLAEMGMKVVRPSAQIMKDFKGIGETIANEFGKTANNDTKTILKAFFRE